MDPKTGKIREFGSASEAEKAGYTIPVRCEPKPNCRRCYGRGYIGTNDRDEKVPCACVMKVRKPSKARPTPETEDAGT